MVLTGQFRQDLRERLLGFSIRTPALADHLEDIPVLAKKLWEKITADREGGGENQDEPRKGYGREKGAGELSNEILIELQRYFWPGNVRELKMVLSCLYGLFHTVKPLTVQHLNAVFLLQGRIPSTGAARKKATTTMGFCRRGECIRHFRRVIDVIHAGEQAIETALHESDFSTATTAAFASSLQYSLEELDMLCQYPLRFRTPSTFESVNRLRSKMLYFRSLMKESPELARKYWKESATDEFKITLSAILNEIDEMLTEESGCLG